MSDEHVDRKAIWHRDIGSTLDQFFRNRGIDISADDFCDLHDAVHLIVKKYVLLENQVIGMDILRRTPVSVGQFEIGAALRDKREGKL